METTTKLTARLVQVARLYYEEDKSQQEIADQMGVSRSLIALYLKQAREQNIVRVEVVDPQDQCEDLALEIQKHTGLKSVHVVPNPRNPELVQRSLAGALARQLENRLADGDRVGLGWGRTITEVVNLLAPSRPRKIEVAPLLGESSFTASYTQINQIVLRMAESFNGLPNFLFAPLIVGTSELRQALLQDNVAKPVAELWDRLDIACIGIGAVPPTPGQVLYMGEHYVNMYLEKGAVGDIVARHFDSRGRLIRTALDERIMGISLEQLRKVKNVIAIAGGPLKTKAVVGAIRTNSITGLVIDEELARAMLLEL